MNRYSYEELKAAALSPDATPADLEALARWFIMYDMEDWNGECFKIDSTHDLYPVHGEATEYDEHPIVGWEIR